MCYTREKQNLKEFGEEFDVRHIGLCFSLTAFAAAVPGLVYGSAYKWKVTEVLEVAKVWSGHPVGFCLLTTGQRQYVAYYDADRRMTVAARDLSSTKWEYQVLPSRVGWDSHNGIVMAVDDTGRLHLAGNMHASPLTYFRTAKPHDISTFERIPHMVPGRPEGRVTYPHFLKGTKGELIFSYRDGSSGNGRRFFNVYDVETQEWKPLFEKPLLDGMSRMNAYPIGPLRGPDGWFHIVWMWRDTPDCRTNHDISYARSRDLVHWETADGKPLELPITPENREVIVDPVPPFRGLINMGFGLGFDREHRPIVHYHKYDADGNSQIFDARWEGGKWKIYQISDWNVRWEFGGGGSVPCLVRAGPVRVGSDGLLWQSYSHFKFGRGIWKLDPQTLRRVGEVKDEQLPRAVPPEWEKPELGFPGIEVRWCGDSGDDGDPNVRYMLRWETLPPNRDRPREGPLPPPSTLRVIKLEKV